MSTNPFSPVRDENPVAYLACMAWLDALPYVALDEKVTLRAIINYTTNKNLLLQLPQLTTDEVRDLYELSLRALTNLRSSWGAPETSSTTSSPAPSRIVSRAPSPPRTSASPPPIGTAVSRALGTEEFSLVDLIAKARSTSFSSTTALERQSDRCLLTGFSADGVFLETAHLFPSSSLLNGDCGLTWVFLAIFLGESIRNHLATEITVSLHTCSNSVSMEAGLHSIFDRGRFTLIPVSKPTEPLGNYCLDVKLVWWSPAFFLQSRPSVRAEDPDEQCSIDSDGMIVVGLGPPRILRSGSIIRISTQDPQGLPLPSESLLWWHASIWQVIGSAGLSETVTAGERNKAVASSRTEGPAAGPKRKRSPDDELDIHSSAEYRHLWARKHLPSDLLAQYDVDPLEPEDDIA
ncbi:hypothetical protein TWF696_004376 [Orbilia brochopaga]|uniref:HNH nuclease domain-containing protein n=1 Tax=Orbilia brochopaga TaxID=3140254 RepID=A0AAV9VCG0_9PEZI